jgi:hypothetical protein
MSTHPRIESRVSVLERRQINLEAQLEDLSEDMAASFKQLSEYLGKIEDRFDRTEKDIAEIKATMATKEDIAEIKTTMATKEDIAEIKATMATKEDTTAMEGRILDAFKQLLATINPQSLPPQP